MSKLKMAIQKSGRLNQDSLDLLRSCGLRIENGKDQLKVAVKGLPLEILFLRNSDIPQYLEDGVADIAIVGENLLKETQTSAKIIQPLGFSMCRLALAVPKASNVNDISFFNGKRIATSYPLTLKEFLSQNEVSADIHVISGSVEIAPNIGLADAVCDIVSTGSTLFKNGLKESFTVLESQAVLASSPTLTSDQQVLLDQLEFRIQAVLNAQRNKYVLMNVPNDRISSVANLLPVLKSPTVLPLALPGWSSLHSVIQEDAFWKVIDELKSAGAEDILVVPIDKMMAV